MILVDPLQKYPHHMIKAGARKHGVRWCHLVSDSSFEELHTFAEKLGLKRAWFQGDHYDLTPGKRRLAVNYGAIEVRAIELVGKMVKI